MDKKERLLKKEMFIKHKKAIEILESDEYKDYIKKFEQTNKRFYYSGIEKLFLNTIGTEGEVEELFTKAYPVYDILYERFTIATLNKFSNVNFPTFSYKDCKKIVEWLNMKLDELTVDDVIFENIIKL